MATSQVTPTNRRKWNQGSLVCEDGTFTEPNGDDFWVETKVGRVLWCKIRGSDDAGNEALIYWNSKSASNTEDDSGVFFIANGELTAEKVYGYEVVGTG